MRMANRNEFFIKAHCARCRASAQSSLASLWQHQRPPRNMSSVIGLFLFVPPGINEQLIETAGFQLVRQEDVTKNAALVSGRWHDARDRYKDALLKIEGGHRFAGLQKFFAAVHQLTSEGRLSRVAYVVEKPGS
jgi:hypothetical protein